MNKREKLHKNSALRHTIINLLLVVMIVFLYYALGTPNTVAVFSNDIIYRTSDKKKISLECVIAWDTANLDGILQTLKDKNCSISFVISGAWAADNADSLKQIVDGNHAIATCGMNYNDSFALDKEQLAQSISSSLKIIKEQCGINAAFYYCPISDTKKAKDAARLAKLTCVRCTVDLLSGRDDADAIITRAKNSARGASIIAFTPTVCMTEALPQILDYYTEKGFTVGGVEVN